MCHFITLVAPTDDVEAVRAVMDRHGRAANPIDNPSLRRLLRPGERQYLTTRDHCDCGTVLAARHDTPEAVEGKLVKEAARLKRKGWSEAKVARAMKDRHAADDRPSDGPDSLELWSAALRDLGKELGLPYAGLFVRFYSGTLATEAFTASRREVPRDVQRVDALSSLKPGELTIFALGSRA